MEAFVDRLLSDWLGKPPVEAARCAQGIGNYVFEVCCSSARYILRCSREAEAYKNTALWLNKLAVLDIPVPKVVRCGAWHAVPG